MHIRIKKMNMWSMSRIFGILQAGVGLITGVFFTLTYFVDPEFLKYSIGGAAAIFGVWSFIVLPILNGALGFLSGALVAWLYNAYVRFFGSGVAFEVETQEN